MRIFAKVLSETDVKRRCAVPMKYFKRECFPKPTEGKHTRDFEVTDDNGLPWILRCSTRNTGEDLNHPKHPKPVLIKAWIPFVQSKKLIEGDRVIIYEEQDETGSMRLRITVEKRTSPPESCWSPINQNLDGNKGSISHNSDNESTATFQPVWALSADVQNRDLSRSTTVISSSIDKEQISTPRSTSQHIACSTTDKPSLSLNLELTLKPIMTGGTAAATSSSIDKEQTPTFDSTSQDIACNKTEMPSLNLSLGLALKPTMVREQQHACMQETQLKTFEFLRRFIVENKVAS